jgi:hypothetical protein
MTDEQKALVERLRNKVTLHFAQDRYVFPADDARAILAHIDAQAAENARLREDCQRARVLLLKPWSSEDVEDARFILGAALAQETQP